MLKLKSDECRWRTQAKRRVAEIRDEQYCGIEYSSEKRMKNTGKEEKERQDEYAMDKPVTGRAIVMIV